MDSIKSQLMDMGFNEAKVKRAIESCPEAQTLEQVMEWLIAHEDEIIAEPQANSSAQNDVVKAGSESVADSNDTSQQTSSGAVEANETAANMAARKKITVEEAQRIITERQAKRAEEERKKAIEDEKRRRLDGQKMAETRAELQDQERIRLAQQIRKEKLEKEMHRKQVLEQIARDREALKLRNNLKTATANSSSPNSAAGSSCTTKMSPTKGSATECRLALRFPDGSSLIHKFSSQEQLAAVRLFVQIEKGAGNEIEFVAPPNRKLTEASMNETLESLGLCPASRLEVKYTHFFESLD